MRKLQEFQEVDGHITTVVGLDSGADSLRDTIVTVLKQIWVGDTMEGADSDDLRNAFREIGIDIDAELRSRGLENPLANDKYQLIKDYGDIGEVLGYLRELQLRGIPSADIFAPILWNKLRATTPTHGLDGIAG